MVVLSKDKEEANKRLKKRHSSARPLRHGWYGKAMASIPIAAMFCGTGKKCKMQY